MSVQGKVAMTLSMVVFFGCSQNQSSPTPSPAPQLSGAKQNSVTNQVPPAPPPDGSLESDEYLVAGMPAHDRTWLSADMLHASESLHAIARSNIKSLPRYGSSRSGDLFARMTAKDCLEFYRNESLPLEQRLEHGMNHQLAMNQVLKLYLHAYNKQASGSDEMIELMNAQVRITAVLATLTRQFMAKQDKADPSYAVRAGGVAKMRNGIATLVSGCLDSVTEGHIHTVAERKRVLDCLTDTLPELLPELPTSTQKELEIRLRSFQENPNMIELEPELSRAAELLSNLVRDNTQPGGAK